MTVQTLETNKNIDYTCIPYGGDRYFLSHVIVTLPKNKDDDMYVCEFFLIPATSIVPENNGIESAMTVLSVDTYRELIVDDKWSHKKLTHAFPLLSLGRSKDGEKSYVFWGFTVKGSDCHIRVVDGSLNVLGESHLDCRQAADYGVPVDMKLDDVQLMSTEIVY